MTHKGNLTMSSVLTKFSKGIKESAALSFSRSASKNCSPGCKQLNNGCYAETVEKRYKDYGLKLIRHGRTAPHNLLYLALAEVQRRKLSWFRFSVSGSLPPVSRIRDKVRFAASLKELCSFLISNGALIHLPVESYPKAVMVRKILAGLPVVVRRSCQSLSGLLKSKDSVSWVVPKGTDVKKLADSIRESGKSVVVCPAIISSSKCGQCKACANKFVDIVLYPKHR